MNNIQYKNYTFELDEFNLNKVYFDKPNISYTLYGDLSNNKKLALFFHGFSSNSEIHIWWDKLPLDKILEQYNLICFDSLGTCYKSLGPSSINLKTNEPYLKDFPQITIQDTIDFLILGLKKLNINNLDLVLGCSLGGMQALDMFIRYPEMGKKFISACGSPLPLMTKLINSAQCNMIEEGIKSKLTIAELKERMGFARFFFRLSCTSEASLRIFKKTHHKNEFTNLENYFLEDKKDYQNIFCPYSYFLYMKMLLNFQISLPEKINFKNFENTNLLLIDITGDIFTPQENIHEIYTTLRNQNLNVRIKTFKTDFGHEAWIIVGENYYEFIKAEFAI